MFKFTKRAVGDSFNSEDELHIWLEENLSDDFHLYHEVWGEHLYSDNRGRIDFIAYPKQHLIDIGFRPKPFGIEVKHFKIGKDGFMRKCTETLKQAHTYNECTFNLGERKNKKPFKPEFTAVFSNLSFSSEREELSDRDNDRLFTLLRLANHNQVCELMINGFKDNLRGYAFKFGGASYFSKNTYNGEVKSWVAKNGDKILDKSRFGNFS